MCFFKNAYLSECVCVEGHGGGEKGRERQPVGPLEITMC